MQTTFNSREIKILWNGSFCDPYKGFQLWLETKFANGVPSLQELEAISNEDMPPTSDPAAVEYPASPLLQDSPLYLDDQVKNS